MLLKKFYHISELNFFLPLHDFFEEAQLLNKKSNKTLNTINFFIKIKFKIKSKSFAYRIFNFCIFIIRKKKQKVTYIK